MALDYDKQEAIELYQSMEPTPETTSECIKEVSEQLGASPNSIRMVLNKAGVYVKQVKVTSSKEGSSTKRTSKAAAQEELISLITEKELPLDEEIIGRMTGKAMLYVASLIK